MSRFLARLLNVTDIGFHFLIMGTLSASSKSSSVTSSKVMVPDLTSRTSCLVEVERSTGTFTAFERAVKNVLTLSAKLGLSPADREKLMSFSNIKKDVADPYLTLKTGSGG